jgi:hypothetical protein
MACLTCFWGRRGLGRAKQLSSPYPAGPPGDPLGGPIEISTTGSDIQIELSALQARMAGLGHFTNSPMGVEGESRQKYSLFGGPDNGVVKPVSISADLTYGDAGSIGGCRRPSAAKLSDYAGAPIPHIACCSLLFSTPHNFSAFTRPPTSPLVVARAECALLC